MQDYYGWRARIGLIYIADSTVMEPELYAMAPEGVSIHTARIDLADPSAAGLASMMAGDEVEGAARLLGKAPLHVVTFGGTSATFLEGMGFDRKVIARMESVLPGIPASTTSTAALRALRAIGARRISFVSPYVSNIVELGRRFFAENGFDVTGAHGLGIADDPGLNALPLERMYAFAKQVVEPEAEAVFISCTAVRTIGAIGTLEEDLGRPVVSANQATFWDALRIAGVKGGKPGFGSLFDF